MKVQDDYCEKLTKRSPLIFTGYKNLAEVYDYLFSHYQGYHFTIILDVTKDEYEPLPKELKVYFSDEVLAEIAAYAGKKVVEK